MTRASASGPPGVHLAADRGEVPGVCAAVATTRGDDEVEGGRVRRGGSGGRRAIAIPVALRSGARMPLLLALSLGCAAPSPTPADDTAAAAVDPVLGTFVLLDAMTGSPRDDGATVTLDGATVEAGADGATLSVTPGPFVAVATAADSSDHRLVGVAGDADFRLYSYMATRTLTGQVMGRLGRAADPAKGFLVVAMDHADLSPATGASAEIDAPYDTAFVLTQSGVEETNAVFAGAGGFVTFTNVQPGPVSVAISPPEGETCGVFPALAADVPVTVEADTVTVVTWHCAPPAE